MPEDPNDPFASALAKAGIGTPTPPPSAPTITQPPVTNPDDPFSAALAAGLGPKPAASGIHDKSYVDKLNAIAAKHGIGGDDLARVIGFESGHNPQARNKSGATGLIQFMPSTAADLGTTTDALAAMPAVQQLDYVDKYLGRMLKGGRKFSDVYASVLAPAFVGQPDSTVMYSAQRDAENHTLAYAQNKGLDANHDGKITKGEAASAAYGKGYVDPDSVPESLRPVAGTLKTGKVRDVPLLPATASIPKSTIPEIVAGVLNDSTPQVLAPTDPRIQADVVKGLPFDPAAFRQAVITKSRQVETNQVSTTSGGNHPMLRMGVPRAAAHLAYAMGLTSTLGTFAGGPGSTPFTDQEKAIVDNLQNPKSATFKKLTALVQSGGGRGAPTSTYDMALSGGASPAAAALVEKDPAIGDATTLGLAGRSFAAAMAPVSQASRVLSADRTKDADIPLADKVTGTVGDLIAFGLAQGVGAAASETGAAAAARQFLGKTAVGRLAAGVGDKVSQAAVSRGLASGMQRLAVTPAGSAAGKLGARALSFIGENAGLQLLPVIGQASDLSAQNGKPFTENLAAVGGETAIGLARLFDPRTLVSGTPEEKTQAAIMQSLFLLGAGAKGYAWAKGRAEAHGIDPLLVARVMDEGHAAATDRGFGQAVRTGVPDETVGTVGADRAPVSFQDPEASQLPPLTRRQREMANDRRGQGARGPLPIIGDTTGPEDGLHLANGEKLIRDDQDRARLKAMSEEFGPEDGMTRYIADRMAARPRIDADLVTGTEMAKSEHEALTKRLEKLKMDRESLDELPSVPEDARDRFVRSFDSDTLDPFHEKYSDSHAAAAHMLLFGEAPPRDAAGEITPEALDRIQNEIETDRESEYHRYQSALEASDPSYRQDYEHLAETASGRKAKGNIIPDRPQVHGRAKVSSDDVITARSVQGGWKYTPGKVHMVGMDSTAPEIARGIIEYAIGRESDHYFLRRGEVKKWKNTGIKPNFLKLSEWIEKNVGDRWRDPNFEDWSDITIPRKVVADFAADQLAKMDTARDYLAARHPDLTPKEIDNLVEYYARGGDAPDRNGGRDGNPAPEGGANGGAPGDAGDHSRGIESPREADRRRLDAEIADTESRLASARVVEDGKPDLLKPGETDTSKAQVIGADGRPVGEEAPPAPKILSTKPEPIKPEISPKKARALKREAAAKEATAKPARRVAVSEKQVNAITKARDAILLKGEKPGQGLRDAIAGTSVDLSGYQAHGLAKGTPKEQLASLHELLTYGPDKERVLQSGPLKPTDEQRSSGILNTRTDAPFVVVSERGKTLSGLPIRTVLLNDWTQALKPALARRYPDVRFLSPSEIDALGARSVSVKREGVASRKRNPGASLDGDGILSDVTNTSSEPKTLASTSQSIAHTMEPAEFKQRIDDIMKLARSGGSTVFEDLKAKGVRGLFENPNSKWKTGRIRLNHGLTPEQTAETLSHEVAHQIDSILRTAEDRSKAHAAGEVDPNPRGAQGNIATLFGVTEKGPRNRIIAEMKAVTEALVGKEAVAENVEYFHDPKELWARLLQSAMFHPTMAEQLAPTAMAALVARAAEHPRLGEFMSIARGELLDHPTPQGFFRNALRTLGEGFTNDRRQGYEAKLGQYLGTRAWQEEVAYRARRAKAIEDVSAMVAEKFKNVPDRPEQLFTAAEGILSTAGDQPQFGTRIFQDVPKGDAHEVAALKLAGYDYVGEAEDGSQLWSTWRVTPSEAEIAYNSLSEAGKKVVRDFTQSAAEAKDVFSREKMATVYDIPQNKEGWVHHFGFEDKGTGGANSPVLREKKASARKQRTEAEGYTKDLAMAIQKNLAEVEIERIHNEFLSRQIALVAEPLEAGERPAKGWKEVRGTAETGFRLPGQERELVREDGSRVMIGKRYQIPEEVAERYLADSRLQKEMGVVLKSIHRINRYWMGNILLHPGSAMTNFISGGLQLSTKVMIDFYGDLLRGEVHLPRTQANVMGLLETLTPSGWKGAPAWIYGAEKSGFFQQFAHEKVKPNKIDEVYAKGLAGYQLVETFWKKAIVNMEKRQLAPERLDDTEFLGAVNDAIDLYAFDYNNVPVWMDQWKRSALGSAVKPFITYPYKYAKMLSTLAGRITDPRLPVQDRLATLLGLATIAAAYEFSKNAVPGQTVGKKRVGDEVDIDENELKGVVNPRGRPFIGKDASGKEVFVRTAKYPILNAVDVIESLVRRDPNAALEIIKDQVGTIGPAGDLALQAMGYSDEYAKYKPGSVRLAEAASSFMPAGRLLQDTAEALDPKARGIPKTPGQVFGQMIPVGGGDLRERLAGPERTVKIPLYPGEGYGSRSSVDMPVPKVQSDILWREFGGIIVKRVDPDWFRRFQIRAQLNKQKRDAKGKP